MRLFVVLLYFNLACIRCVISSHQLIMICPCHPSMKIVKKKFLNGNSKVALNGCNVNQGDTINVTPNS